MKNKEHQLKPFYVYNIPEELLSTLVEEKNKVHILSEEINKSNCELDKEILLKCSVCKEIEFDSQEEYRVHVRTDWHRLNLKRKTADMPVMDFKEFEEALEDLTESISGSDSESKSSEVDDIDDLFKSKTPPIQEDIIQPQKPKDPIVWTSTELNKSIHIGFYRCLFDYNDSQTFISTLCQNQLNTNTKDRIIALIMVGGGNFAGMIVSLHPKNNNNNKSYFRMDELNILHHKTFHRYTTRRKQGGSQNACDSGRGMPISAGSNLRRYNEAALQTEIRQLLASWKPALDESEMIFIKASGKLNHKILFGYENSVLSVTDKRLKKIPFTTHRATKNELIRCFNELTIAKIVEVCIEETKSFSQIQVTNTVNISKTIKVDKMFELQKKNTSKIIILIKEGDPQKLIDYIENNSLSYDFEFQPISLYQHTSTPLHLSSSLSLSLIVIALLEKGANPTIRNGNGKTPYEIAGDKITQYSFRLCRFKLGEDMWDWRLAHVPSALTEDEIKKRQEQSKELKIKELQQEKLRRENELKKLIQNNTQQNEDSEKNKNKPIVPLSIGKILQDQRNLSPDLQKRIEREKRARAAEERIKKMTQINKN